LKRIFEVRRPSSASWPYFWSASGETTNLRRARGSAGSGAERRRGDERRRASDDHRIDDEQHR
jgi:hypothetical protein